MLQVEMNASVRKDKGKGAMRQLRSKGLTPAVVYGASDEALPVELETQPLYQKLLSIYRRNAIVTLTLDDGSKKYVLVQDVQTDPVKDSLIHADFLEIDVDKPRVFDVAIRFTGNAIGVDLGGILNVVQETVAVEAAPLDIPDIFEIDITEMNLGDSIKIEAIDIPDNLKLVSDPGSVCVSVVSAKKEVEDEVEAIEEGEEAAAEEPAETPEAAPEE